MKIQINGFDIEVNTEESNMTIKVLDATGKELSNNTYAQSLEDGNEITNVEIPSTEETQPAVQEVPAQPVQGENGAQTSTQPETPAQGDEAVQTGESFIPDFATFKKLRKEGKL